MDRPLDVALWAVLGDNTGAEQEGRIMPIGLSCLRRIVAVLAVATLAGCVEDDPSGDVLVIGDSVMWWNAEDDQSIADVIADDFDLTVVNRSVPGAVFGGEGDDIRDQYVPGDWQWVVLDGGANDLGGNCGCGDCMPVVDRLIEGSGDAGDIPEFVGRLRGDGARVVVMGYYMAPDPGNAFAGCEAEFAALHDRLSVMAAGLEGVVFVPADAILSPEEPAHFDPDGIHPSPMGSRLIGVQIGQTITSGL